MRAMPITFKSKHSPDIVMLDAIARQLITMMGHSGAVPGSLAAEDVAAALSSLEKSVARAPDMGLEKVGGDDDEDLEATISVANRALPLLKMLKTAALENDYVIWDR